MARNKAIEATRAQHFDFIITARGNADTGRIAQEKGAWAYVEKPYLIDKIKEILKRSSAGKLH